MDATLLYLVAGFVLSALYFEFRVRRFMHRTAPLALERVLGAFVTREVSKDKEGVEREIWGLSARGKGIVAALTPVLMAEGMKNMKVHLPKFAPINPATGDLDFMAPVLAKAMDGKKLSLNDFIPLLIEKGLPMIMGFMGGGKPGSPTAPSGGGAMSEITRKLIP